MSCISHCRVWMQRCKWSTTQSNCSGSRNSCCCLSDLWRCYGRITQTFLESLNLLNVFIFPHLPFHSFLKTRLLLYLNITTSIIKNHNHNYKHEYNYKLQSLINQSINQSIIEQANKQTHDSLSVCSYLRSIRKAISCSATSCSRKWLRSSSSPRSAAARRAARSCGRTRHTRRCGRQKTDSHTWMTAEHTLNMNEVMERAHWCVVLTI